MSVTVKHPFVSAVPDSGDTSLVRPSNWNADHTIIGLGTAAEKDVGVANGVASLDSGGKVPVSELPAAVLGALSYQGTWNASTNTPALASGVGTKGYYYVVSVAGTTDLDGITDWVVGDWAVYNGTAWQKVDNTDAVTSVNGLTGTVVLTTTNVAEGTNEYFTTARARASVSAGTGISYDSGTGVITNASPSLGGDVVGPASATDNAVARFDATTGKLIQNSVVIIDDTGSVTGVNALTAESLVINNNATLGSSNADTIDVNARITTDLEPNANNAKDIGTSGRNWRDGFFGRTLTTVNLELTGTTSFDGSQGTSGQVLTSAGIGNTPTWTTPTTGTVTSVTGTAPVVSSGGATPAISMAAATSLVNGYLTSTDWTTFNSKGSGTITSIASGNGMNFTTITSTGTVTMGTPSTLTASTTNSLTATSHTHAITTASTNTASTIVSRDAAGDFSAGTITATSFSGSGASLTALNASNLSSGTVPDARISGSYTGMTNLTGTGTVDFAKFLGNAADTAALPSFSWTGDTNTGIYQPAADQIGISTGGTSRFVVTTSAITSTLPIRNATGSAAAPTYSTSGDTNTGIYFPAADTIGFVEGGSEAVRITSAGFVGVGTTAPGARLAVVGTGYSPNINLTDAATVAWNTALGQTATFTFVSTNRTVGAPTSLVNGGFYALAVIQNAGSNTLTWNAVFKWAGGTAPTLSTAAGAKDYFTFRSDGTNLYEQGRSLGVA